MALKDSWINKTNGQDVVDAEDINNIAKSVIELEENRATDGEGGKDGVDGLTPHIGTNGNWWIGDTDTGTKAQGEQGPQGDKGEDGVSVTHSWNGTVLTLTSSSGTDSVDLKGEKGDPGEDAVLNEFELITSGETTEEVNKIVITKDNDGNPLALRDMMTVYMYIPKAESDTAVTVTLNSVLTHQIASAISSSSAKYAKAVLLFTGGRWEPFSLQGASTASQTSWIGRNVTPFYGPENKNTVSGITLFIYDTSLVFPVGTKYQIYGRRV